MSIKARLKRLEKKVAASEPPMREIGVFAGRPLWKIKEEPDGVHRFVPIMTNEEYAAMVYEQQCSLLAELAEKSLEVEAGDKAPTVGVKGDNQAPLKEGQKRPNYVHTTDAKGRAVEIEIATGIRRLV